jgi:hypothetical protein
MAAVRSAAHFAYRGVVTFMTNKEDFFRCSNKVLRIGSKFLPASLPIIIYARVNKNFRLTQ